MLLACCVNVSALAADSDLRVAALERLHRGGESAKALQQIDVALATRPNDAGLRFLQGVIYSDVRRDAEAAQVFERLIADFPELPEPYNNLAVLVAQAGQLDRSRELLELSLRNDPGYRTAHENLGDVYLRLAVRAWESAAGTAGGDASLRRKLKLARELVAAPPLP